MKVLLVTAHPRTDSLTNAVRDRLMTALREKGCTVESADLAAERFDPVLNATDEPDWENPRKIYSPEVVREMDRIERHDASILLFPVYWWSMPALMKGWIDRVWNHGWAYGDRRFPHKQCWMVAIAGNSQEAFEKRGYDVAMHTQLDIGILDYCGIEQHRLEVLYGSIEGDDFVDEIFAKVESIARAFTETQ